MGVGRTFQISNLFRDMTVLDNVRVAARGGARSARVFWWPQRAKDDATDVPPAVRAACKLLVETHPPNGDVLSLRSKAGDARIVEAARDVMAHAYAIVARGKTA